MKKINNNFLFYFFVGIFIFSTFFLLSKPVCAFTDVTEDISSDTEWTIENSPYVIRNDITISAGAVLTINSGVVVKFDPTGFNTINVFGDLIVNGESGNEVYFTSFYDDSIGGDTNEDYSCYPEWDENGNPIDDVCYSMLDPLIDDWYGIYFGNSSNSVIKNAVFKYASEAIILQYSYLNLNNIKILDSKNGITLIESNADADGVDCIDSKNTCLSVFNNSTLNLINSNINTIYYDSVSVSNYSNLNISYSKITNSSEKYHGAISVFNNSNLNISYSEIKNLSGNLRSGIELFNDSSAVGEYLDFSNSTDNDTDYITIFNGSSFDLKNSSFVNCISSYYACIAVFDGSDYANNPSSLIVEKTIFNGGSKDGISIFGDSVIPVNIHHSKIVNFQNLAVNTFGEVLKNIDVKENFWGNETGPFHADKNPMGTAGKVADNIEFIPFCKNEKCQSHNPVILIPGIMGTKILKNYGDYSEIWPNQNELITSFSDDFMDDLVLLDNGTEDLSKPMQLGDIMRSTNVNILGYSVESHIFDGLIEQLTNNGYIEGIDLFVFPYDWRKSNTESAEKLKEKINMILLNSDKEKVDLVAHSMGGLVAKKYIADYTGNNIDHLIFVGTPHLGAPKAFKVLMYGDDMGIGFGYDPLKLKIHILNPERTKIISQNMPGVFELLPSKKYIDGQDGFIGEKYVVDLVTQYISKIKPNLNYEQTKNFLIAQGKNQNLIPFAENLHESTDNLDLSNINFTNFSGCGFTKTIGEIIVKKKKSWTLFGQKIVDDYKINYTNGDETVPLHSANLQYGERYFVKEFSHSGLPSASGIKEMIYSLLNNETPSTFSNVSSSIDSCYVSGKVVSVHSPVTLEIYDENGNYVGLDANGNIEENIPGVQYDVIDGDKFAFLPSGKNYRIVNSAEDIGAFDFYVEDLDGNDQKTKISYWNQIPIETLQTKSEILINTDSIDYIVKIDENNDGVFEKEILPSSILTGDDTQDLTPPETLDTFLNNSITLVSTDDSSGVLKTEYSLDNGNSWVVYNNPITIFNDSIQYFSTDKAGNIESVKTVKLDKEEKRHTSGSSLVFVEDILKPELVSKNIDFDSKNKSIQNQTKEVFDDTKSDIFYKKENTLLYPKTKDTQLASSIKSNFNPKLFWVLSLSCGLIIGLFLARKHIKR